MDINPIIATLFFVVGFAIAIIVRNSNLFGPRKGRASDLNVQNSAVRLDQLGRKGTTDREEPASGNVEPVEERAEKPSEKSGAKPVKARRQKKR